MESTKYVGMDVHRDTVTIAMMNAAGGVVMESILGTKAATRLQFIKGYTQTSWLPMGMPVPRSV